MAHYNFLRDLSQSQEAVDAIINHFIDKGFVAYELIGKKQQKFGDLTYVTTNGDEFFVEVKYDIKAADTNNLCFEMSNGKKMTGIMATKADLVHYVVPRKGYKEVFVFCTEKLRKYIQNPSNVNIKNGGDKKKFILALVSLNKIEHDELPMYKYEIKDVNK